MKKREFKKLQNEFDQMVIDFWIDNDVPDEWLLRLLVEGAAQHTVRVEEELDRLKNEN